MVIPALIAGGAAIASGIMGAQGARRAAKKAKKAQQEALARINMQRPLLQRGYADYLKALQGAEQSVVQGRQAAKQAFAQQGTAALQSVQEESAKALGDIKQHLVNTGTYSTALMSNAQRGVSAQATRQITAVREMVARLAGGVEMDTAPQLAQLGMARGSAAMEYAGQQANLEDKIASLWANTQFTSSSGAAGWGTLLAQLAPLFAQGIGGGGGGPSGGYQGKVTYQYQH